MKKVSLHFSIVLTIVLTVFLVGCSKNSNKGDLDQYTRIEDTTSIVYYEKFDSLVSDVSSGTYYIYFGKPNCPWCQQYLPYYIEYAELFNQKILYYNAEHVKGTYETINENNEIVLHVNEEYEKVVEWIHQSDMNLNKGYVQYNLFLQDSKGNLHTKLWLYVPKLFKVIDGKIVDMVATISEHEKVKDENGKMYLPELTEEQQTVLRNELERLFTTAHSKM